MHARPDELSRIASSMADLSALRSLSAGSALAAPMAVAHGEPSEARRRFHRRCARSPGGAPVSSALERLAAASAPPASPGLDRGRRDAALTLDRSAPGQQLSLVSSGWPLVAGVGRRSCWRPGRSMPRAVIRVCSVTLMADPSCSHAGGVAVSGRGGRHAVPDHAVHSVSRSLRASTSPSTASSRRRFSGSCTGKASIRRKSSRLPVSRCGGWRRCLSPAATI